MMLSVYRSNERGEAKLRLDDVRGDPKGYRFAGYWEQDGISPTAWAGAAAVSLALWLAMAATVSAYVG